MRCSHSADASPQIGIDLGGSLIKVSVRLNSKYENFEFPSTACSEMLQFIEWRCSKAYSANPSYVCLTGGGSQKHYKTLQKYFEQRKWKFRFCDEMDSIVCGIYLENCSFLSNGSFIIVQIGSGVSLVKVESRQSYCRVSGTALGGGTFKGLGYLLSKSNDYNALLKMATDGFKIKDNVNLKVRDIYGGDYLLNDLTAETIASFFGGINILESSNELSLESIIANLLQLVCTNICHIACLVAKNEKVQNLLFSGGFPSHSTVKKELLKALNMISREEGINAHFLDEEESKFIGSKGSLFCHNENIKN